jgi:hypothetical protein
MRRYAVVPLLITLSCGGSSSPPVSEAIRAESEVGRYWARLAVKGAATQGESFWFEWKERTLTDWSWAFKGPEHTATDANADEWVYGLKPGTRYDYRLCKDAGCTDAAEMTTQPASHLRRILIDPTHPKELAYEGGGRFVPWGTNFIGVEMPDHASALVDRAMMNDFEAVTTALQRVTNVAPPDGALNSLRIHVQLDLFLSDATTPRRDAVARLARVIESAEDRDLYVMLCGLNYFYPPETPIWIATQHEAERWKTQALWWNTIAGAVHESPGLFGYDLVNEPLVAEGAPTPDGTIWYSGSPPDKYCAYGDDPEHGHHGTCFPQLVSRELNGREPGEVAAQWTQTMKQAIRHTSYFDNDTRHLITVGVAGAALANTPFFDPRVSAELDFLSPHLYPDAADEGDAKIALSQMLSSTTGKPVIVGETFTFGNVRRLISQTCNDQSAQGWMGQWDGRRLGDACASANVIGCALYDDWYKVQAEFGPTIQGGGCPARVP